MGSQNTTPSNIDMGFNWNNFIYKKKQETSMFLKQDYETNIFESNFHVSVVFNILAIFEKPKPG